MNDSEKYISDVMDAGLSIPGFSTNAPTQYHGRQRQYMHEGARMFAAEHSYLSTDYFSVQVQGILHSDFYKFVSTKARMADISTGDKPSLDDGKTDDFKQIIFSDPKIDYFPLGAKVVCAGSTYICVNPSNISSVYTTAILARCNASYNSYDDYGNIVTEPIVVKQYRMMNNDNQVKDNYTLLDGYYTVICQLNENTAKLGQNRRIILGTKAYAITGWQDFLQEFTGDRSSAHYLTFTARLEEPTADDDISENFIAGGNSQTFSVSVSGGNAASTGQSVQLSAYFVRCGEVIQGTDELPVSFSWSSSDETVATVSQNGVVTAISEGEATIRAALSQNKRLTANFAFTVQSQAQEPYVSFTEPVPDALSQYESVTVSAAYFENGQATSHPLAWTFSRAKKSAYHYEISEDGKSATITCNSPAGNPLVVTATYGGHSAAKHITLEGY